MARRSDSDWRSWPSVLRSISSASSRRENSRHSTQHSRMAVQPTNSSPFIVWPIVTPVSPAAAMSWSDPTTQSEAATQ
ncbi:hypothetical protein [Azospirillum thermophilum]|uniref:hypothetical protein n=1 Tax=Azospirillum thermophilum TaxID=2202148 RepID=UPI00143CF548|nr:hypothetical protein [Azospirillum thermophilum]